MNIKYRFIGWHHEDNHDKVWGVIWLENQPLPNTWFDPDQGRKCVIFWGRRGQKLQTQIFQGGSDLISKIRSKISKGYEEIGPDKLDDVYPEFQKDLQKLTIWSMLKY
jgi:hypothetical protein